ncbi:MAG: HD-GYP domain-containing protein [Firmicutes bacterium]|nr:HD-GYP domain-containing protein [Bacillota bacterium]
MTLAQVIPLGLVSAVFAYFPVRIGHDTIVVFITPLGLAFITILGPVSAVAGVLAGVVVAELLFNRKAWEKTVFNIALFTIGFVATGVTFLALGGNAGQPIGEHLLLLLFAMGLIEWLVNLTVFSGLMSLLRSTSFFGQLRDLGKATSRHVFVDALAAILFISIYQSIGTPGLFFMAALLLLVRYGFQAYYQLQKSYEEVQTMLISILDARDSYTAGHSTRVSANAVKLATELKLQPREVENIRRAGLLHDIGKVNVPDNILQKPGKLDETETRQMNQHPVDGARFVEGVSSLKHLAPIIRHHHERYNGKGYPDGISGETIPLGARVLSVADAFDAMITDRPYRKALTRAQALQQILENAGTQFDKQVAMAAVKVLGPGLQEYPQLQSLAAAVRLQLAATKEELPEGQA